MCCKRFLRIPSSWQSGSPLARSSYSLWHSTATILDSAAAWLRNSWTDYTSWIVGATLQLIAFPCNAHCRIALRPRLDFHRSSARGVQLFVFLGGTPLARQESPPLLCGVTHLASWRAQTSMPLTRRYATFFQTRRLETIPRSRCNASINLPRISVPSFPTAAQSVCASVPGSICPEELPKPCARQDA